jgi:hypothetical protein
LIQIFVDLKRKKWLKILGQVLEFPVIVRRRHCLFATAAAARRYCRPLMEQ